MQVVPPIHPIRPLWRLDNHLGSGVPRSKDLVGHLDALAGAAKSEDLKFVEFENRALASEFAMAGNGVCLPDLLAMQLELRSGQLIRMHDYCLELETGNHLVFPETHYPDPRLMAFSSWLEQLFSAKRAAAEAAGFGLAG